MPLFKALRVSEENGQFIRQISEQNTDDLPEGEVLVRVHYSALNYKDALSATGHKGVTRNFPHTPGVDASGIVEASSSPDFSPGDKVIVTSYDLGMNTPGGFGQYIRVPAEWVINLPENLSLEDSMVHGTAGFTAGLGLLLMERMGQNPQNGSVLITGASGGVGSMAVAIFAKAGYEVIASTGKESAHEYLKGLGASQCIDRSEANDESGRPLLRPKWAGAFDTVGGNTLATALKACKPHGNVAACGLVESPNLSTTVYPFIINGVNLLGVDSATCPRDMRQQVWDYLAGKWYIDHFEQIKTLTSLAQLDPYIDQILEGKTRGRVVVNMS